MMRVLTALPELPQQRYILNPQRGYLSVIVPIARTNLITNPSFETNTTSWTASGGASIARSTTFQYHGAYSLAVTPGAGTTDGVFYGTVSLTSGTTYAASIKIRGAAGVPYKISFATTGAVDLASYTFYGAGRWQWVWVYYTETSSTTRRIYVTKNTSTSTALFYLDGAQVEAITAGELVSTYIDGDQQSLLAAGQFPPAYGWIGTRHASTSYRTAQTRDGGMVKNFDLYKFFVTAITGLGLAGQSHVVARSGLTDGSSYQTSFVPSREFAVSGRFNTNSPTALDQARSAFGQAIALDATAPRQPIALIYQPHDGLTPTGDAGTIIASYKDGLARDQLNIIGEDASAQFVQWLPFLRTFDGGAALTQSETITTTTISNLLYRDATGDWSRLSGFTLTTEVLDIIQHPDGTWYIAGSFTTIGGTAANGIARYDPTTGTFSALGTGLGPPGASGQRLFVDPQGLLYVGGNFTTANGVTVNHITYWNGSTFVALGSGGTKGVNNTVRGVTMDASGNLYVTGSFTQAGGGAAAGIARLTPAGTWSALGTGLAGSTATGQGLATARNGTNIYVGGDFTTANGVAAADIAMWNGTTFEALGTGVNSDVRDVITAPNGDIYATGDFTTAGGVTVNFIARWNGTQWFSLGSGVTTGTFGQRLAFGYDGLLHMVGAFTAVNNITTGDSYAIWNGSAWLLPDADMAGSPQAETVGVGRRGEVMIAYFNGTASDGVAAQLNTLTNGGTAATFPTFTITGPSSSTSRLHVLRNYTTGAVLNFNLTIFANEVITIRTGPDVVTVVSETRGDLTQYVLPGSVASFPLIKGANSISLFITGGTVTTIARWDTRVQSADDLTYQ